MNAVLSGSRAWRPTPALKVTAALHAAAAAMVVATPESWPAVASVIAANHLALAGAGLAPKSSLLGPNLVRLPAAARARGEVALTFDDGPDPAITPQVLDALEAHDARATFFCVGERALAHAALAREIVRRGHRIENHTQRHSRSFGWYGWRQLRRELDDAQRTLAAVTGTAPHFFRAPFGMRNPLLEPALARSGLRLVSWTRRGFDTVDAAPGRVLQRLARGLEAGDILVLHDGIASSVVRTRPVTLDVLPALLERIAERGLRCVTLRDACGLAA